MDFDTCLQPFNHHLSQDTEHFHHSHKSPEPFVVNSISSWPEAARDLLSVTMDQFSLSQSFTYMELYSEYFQAGTRGMQMSCLRCKVKQTLILNFVLVTTQQCTLYHTHLYLFLLLRFVNFVVLVVCSRLVLIFIVWTFHSLLIHLPVQEHLGCSYFCDHELKCCKC